MQPSGVSSGEGILTGAFCSNLSFIRKRLIEWAGVSPVFRLCPGQAIGIEKLIVKESHKCRVDNQLYHKNNMLSNPSVRFWLANQVLLTRPAEGAVGEIPHPNSESAASCTMVCKGPPRH